MQGSARKEGCGLRRRQAWRPAGDHGKPTSVQVMAVVGAADTPRAGEVASSCIKQGSRLDWTGSGGGQRPAAAAAGCTAQRHKPGTVAARISRLSRTSTSRAGDAGRRWRTAREARGAGAWQTREDRAIPCSVARGAGAFGCPAPAWAAGQSAGVKYPICALNLPLLEPCHQEAARHACNPGEQGKKTLGPLPALLHRAPGRL